MGRFKTRAKAVDVTKSLLQPTSVTDHIAVQISPNVVIQVAEEDLSPTQGSEAAFALRREGKLDTTMKLCLNWRQGNCHNHAACSFAHVVRYFGVMGDLPNPMPSGRSSLYGTTASGGTYSSVAAGASGLRGASGTAGSANNNNSSTSWSQKLAPPSYSTAANRGGLPRPEDRKAALPTLPLTTAGTSTPTTAALPVAAAASAAASATAEANAVTPPSSPPTTATQATVGGETANEAAPSARSTASNNNNTNASAAGTAEMAETAKEKTDAPPTPASTAAATPNVRPVAAPPVALPNTNTSSTAAAAAAAAGPVPPAVLSGDGLRSILLSLSSVVAANAATAKSTAAATAPTSDAKSDGAAEKATAEAEVRSYKTPHAFLTQQAAAPALDAQRYPWAYQTYSTIEEVVEAVLARGIGDSYKASKEAHHVYRELAMQRPAYSRPPPSKPRSEAGRSPDADFGALAAQAMSMQERQFSTNPAMRSPFSPGLREHVEASSPAARLLSYLGRNEESYGPAPGLNYHQLMNMFDPEE